MLALAVKCMVQKVGLAQVTAQAISNRPPRLIIIAGATGVGKSTAAVGLAGRAGITRVVSTDNIREVMRAGDPERQNPTLHRSSFSKGESGEATLDWSDTSLALESGILATIQRAKREGIDLIIEGVHMNPSARILNEWREAGGVAVGAVMVVHEERVHRNMLRARDVHSYRRADRYLANFQRIRTIQDGLMERATIAHWPLIDPAREESDVERLFALLNKEIDEHGKV